MAKKDDRIKCAVCGRAWDYQEDGWLRVDILPMNLDKRRGYDLCSPACAAVYYGQPAEGAAPVVKAPEPEPDAVIEEERGWWCADCEEFTGDEPDGPLYECGDCGTVFNRDNSYDGDSNRCPDCRKFSAKIADFACPNCGEAEAVPAVRKVIVELLES